MKIISGTQSSLQLLCRIHVINVMYFFQKLSLTLIKKHIIILHYILICTDISIISDDIATYF